MNVLNTSLEFETAPRARLSLGRPPKPNSLLFLVLVVAPTLLAVLYYGLIASKIYISEARFVVRTVEEPGPVGGLGGVFKGFTTAGQGNLLFVRDYVLSRQMASELQKSQDLRRIYAKGDGLSRFPRLFAQRHSEAFYEYYQKKIQLKVDPESSVAILTVRAFDPSDAERVNVALLAKVNRRIDALNAQIRGDSLSQAERELGIAEQNLIRAEGALARYRRAHHVIDPERQAGIELQSEQEIASRLLGAQVRLAQVEQLAPQSPQIPALRTEVQGLRAGLEQMRATVTGASDASRAQMSEEFRALTLKRDIAARTLTAANEARLRARLEAERRHLYLEVVSRPSVPDGSLYPKRFLSILSVLLLSLICWAGAVLLRAGVREHGDAL